MNNIGKPGFELLQHRQDGIEIFKCRVCARPANYYFIRVRRVGIALGVVQICGVNSGGIYNYLVVEPTRIVCQVLVSTAYLVTPPADRVYFAMPFYKRGELIFGRGIGQPNGIVEVVDNFFAKDFGEDPFK